MGTLVDNILENLHTPRSKRPLSLQEAREELQSLRSDRERVLAQIKAIERSHWYAIHECPQRREKDLKKAQETFYRVCARMSDLSAMLYRRVPQTKEVLFYKERQGERLYRLVLSERDPEKYFLGILGPELVYQERRPMSLEEFRKSHPNAVEPEPQEVQQALEHLLQRLKVFMGYYAL